MRCLSQRNENELHRSGVGILLSRNGRHLLASQQIGEFAVRNCFVQNVSVHS